MAKLNKMYYHTSKGEKKLNCYYIQIPKDLVAKTGLSETEVQVTVKDGKIIIERSAK